jgi:hypothetical protein
MAVFMHITNAQDAANIRRNGLKPRLAMIALAAGTLEERRVVFCVPIVADFQATFQWLRELKRRGHRTAVGVQFRIDDRQEVWLGHFGQPHERLSAAEAVGRYMKTVDPRGLQVLVPRRVTRSEIMRIRKVPQLMGWRFSPNSKNTGTTWWPRFKGGIKVRRVMASLNRKDKRASSGRF